MSDDDKPGGDALSDSGRKVAERILAEEKARSAEKVQEKGGERDEADKPIL